MSQFYHTWLNRVNISRWYTPSWKQRHHILFWALTRLCKLKQNFWILNKLLIRIFVVSVDFFFEKKNSPKLFSSTYMYSLQMLICESDMKSWKENPNMFKIILHGWVFMLLNIIFSQSTMYAEQTRTCKRFSHCSRCKKKNISDYSICTRENVIVYKSLYLIVFCWLVLDSILLTFVKQ